ncbi:diguanylate cyclase [Rhizobium sp.]|uniref:diguanylate cyclase n=1 Tax=Rhizobium sp. TaxID=391 RepID=UPI002AA86A2C
MNGIGTLILVNIALAVLFATVWSRADFWLDERRPALRPVGLGIVGGCASIAAMMFPIHIAPGVFTDMRTASIALSGLIGGPISALCSATIAIVYRVSLGGLGAGAGTITILLAAVIGVAISWNNENAILSTRRIVLFSAGVATVPQLAIFVLPSDLWAGTLRGLAVLVPLLFTVVLIATHLLRSELRLREKITQAKLYRLIAQTLPESLNAKDLQGRFIIANPATARALNVSDPSELIGKTDRDFHPPDLAARYMADEQAVLESGTPAHIDQCYQRPDGQRGWLSTLKNPIYSDLTGEIVGIVTHNRDITAQKELETKLAESQQQLSDALANMADGLVMFDRTGNLVYCNTRYQALFSKTAHLRVPGANIQDIITASRACGEEVKPQSTAEPPKPSLLTPNNREIHLWDGRTLEVRTRSVGGGGSIMVFTDVTRTREAEDVLKNANRALEKVALTDGLTGLFNRRAFDDKIAHEFARARRATEPLSLLMVDIDHFKLFNDHYGHQVGDECLRQVAARLKAIAKRSTDTAARYGGEEMALILPNTAHAGALELAERYQAAVRALRIPHVGSSKNIVTVSIGVATIVPQNDDRVEDLIADADRALYCAKHDGRDCYRTPPTVDPILQEHMPKSGQRAAG